MKEENGCLISKDMELKVPTALLFPPLGALRVRAHSRRFFETQFTY